MSTIAVSKSAATFGKYLFWTAVAAGIQYAVSHLSSLTLPEWTIPLIGAALKAAATYVSVQLKEG